MSQQPTALLLLLTFCLPASTLAQGTSSPAHSAPSASAQAKAAMSQGQSSASAGSSGQAATSQAESPALAAADQLFVQAKYAEAAARYEAIANAAPSSVPAQVGLIRSYLVLQKLDEAQAAATTALALQPKSALLLTTVGDLQFREGKILDAEKTYVKAENLAPKDAAPHLGLSRVYRAYSLYRHSYDEMKRAHELAPEDIAVQLLWFNSLPMTQRVPALEAYLATPAGQDTRVGQLRQYLAFLKKNAGEPEHPCTLVSKVEETTTKLSAIPRPGTILGASGLAVKIGKEELHLALDTGATGILLGRASAEKAGLQRLAYQPIAGVGGGGQQGGYTAVADRIRVGDLEFQDCIVRVMEAATPVTGQDGLIGADVFSSYLIDIDIPGAKLRLSPLPKRPEGAAAAPVRLRTVTQDGEEYGSEGGLSEPASNGKVPDSTLPNDAYVAPQMADWTKVYRFHSLLLVPTLVDRTGPMLFMIDTGAFTNILSTRAAHEVTQIRADSSTQVKGLGGTVSKIYRADKAALQFGRYEQQNQDIVTFDLSAACKQTGTEVSGILGFAMLRILQIKIDYRDGLVDFVFDPKRLPKQIKVGR